MDARLAELERLFKATGEGESALLLERARGGEILPGRLAFAAWLGYPAALEAVGEVELPGPEDREAWARFALHAAELAHDETLSQVPTKGRYSHPPRIALESLREALREWPPEPLDPEELHAEFWLEPKSHRLLSSEPSFYRVLYACCYAYMAAHGSVDSDPQRETARRAAYDEEWGSEAVAPDLAPESTSRALALAAYHRSLEALMRMSGWRGGEGRQGWSPGTARERVRAAHLARLAPWLVGHGDPLLQRVQLDAPALRADLEAADAALAANPADVHALERVAEIHARAGWRYDGKTLEEWCAAFDRGWNHGQVASPRLRELGPKATLAVIRVLSGPPSERRDRDALGLLLALGPQGRAAESLVLARAQLSLAGGPPASPTCDASWYLRPLLALETPETQAMAARFLQQQPSLARLAHTSGPRGVAFLESQLDGGDPLVAAWSAACLAPHTDSERLRPWLGYGLSADRPDDLRCEALKAARKQGLLGAFRAEVLACLDLREEGAVVRPACHAVVAAGWEREKDARARLQTLLEHEQVIAEDAARAALDGRLD